MSRKDCGNHNHKRTNSQGVPDVQIALKYRAGIESEAHPKHVEQDVENSGDLQQRHISGASDTLRIHVEVPVRLQDQVERQHQFEKNVPPFGCPPPIRHEK